MELLTCQELVELLTGYLEGTLAPRERARFEAHLAGCSDCDAHLHQMRTTIEALGRIPTEELSPRAVATLTEAFAGWKAGT
jgi:anti-sigma factor RsiW